MMTTITREDLTKQLEEAKLNIKLMDASELIVDCFNRREEFEFTAWTMEFSLFEKTLFSCGNLTIKSRRFAHFSDMCSEVMTDEDRLKVRRLKAAVKMIENNEDASWRILLSAAHKL